MRNLQVGKERLDSLTETSAPDGNAPSPLPSEAAEVLRMLGAADQDGAPELSTGRDGIQPPSAAPRTQRVRP